MYTEAKIRIMKPKPNKTTKTIKTPTSGMSFFTVLRDTFLPHEDNNHHPHALRHSMLFSYTLAIIMIKIMILSLGAVYPSIDSLADTITSYNVYIETNKTRLGYKIPELTLNGKLSAAAQAKADDMMLKQYFAHTSPEGLSPWHWIRTAGYQYARSGENLAIHFTDTQPMNQAWMASLTHKKNILNPEFSETGIGIAMGNYQGFQTIIVVQMFGKPLSAITARGTTASDASTEIQAAVNVQENNPQVRQLPTPKPTSVLGESDNEQLSEPTEPSISVTIDQESPTRDNSINELSITPQKNQFLIALETTPIDQAVLKINDNETPLTPSLNKKSWSTTLLKTALTNPQEPQLISVIIKDKGKETEQPLAWAAFAASTHPLQLWSWTDGASMNRLGVYTPERVQLFAQFFYLLMLGFLFFSLVVSIFTHLHKPNPKLIAHVLGVMSVLLVITIFI